LSPGQSHGALVLGANYRALGVVRSLGRRGIPVRVVKNDHARIALLSRYARGTAAKELGGWMLIPTDDHSAVRLARDRRRLSEHYVVAAPDWDMVRWAHDKRLTHQLALDLGVGSPTTFFGGIDQLARAPWRAPAILKPAIKRARNRFVDEKAWPVSDEGSLRGRYAEASALVPADEILLQELIPGDGRSQLSYAALANEGRVIASITAARLRQYPMDFGRESTYVETIEAPDVADLGGRVIAGIGYTGLVEVEFKRDARDGELKLLDINPRVWGWHTLGARAGVDFPYLEWLMRHGQRVPESHGRPGVRWVRMSTDAAVAAKEIASGRLSPRAYAGSLRGPLEHAMLCRDDPLPALADAPLLLVRRLAVAGGRPGAGRTRRS